MKKLLCILVSAALLCVLFAGCTVEEQQTVPQNAKYYFYYMNSEETRLMREAYVPEEETADYMLRDLISRMNSHKSRTVGVNLLTEDVEISSYEIADSVLQLKFNNSYSKMAKVREILVRAGIVKTFIQVPGIDAVKFFVGNKELTDIKEQPVGEMNGSTFVEFPSADKDGYRYDTFTLYFTDKEGKKLVEEKRKVYYKRNIPRERVALEQLAKGPMEKNHYPTIPESTEILGIAISDKACYVNFNYAFLDYALTHVEENIPVYSVVNTVIAASGAEKVQISVEGKGEVTFRENMELYNFYKRNESLIAREEKEE